MSQFARNVVRDVPQVDKLEEDDAEVSIGDDDLRDVSNIDKPGPNILSDTPPQ